MRFGARNSVEALESALREIDGSFGHPPPGCQLTAGDREQPAFALEDFLFAGDIGGRLPVCGDQRAESSEGAAHVCTRKLRGGGGLRGPISTTNETPRRVAR